VFRLEVADVDAPITGIEYRRESGVDHVFDSCVLSQLLTLVVLVLVTKMGRYFCSLAASLAESEFHSRPFFE
jgi:hypothetical protein